MFVVDDQNQLAENVFINKIEVDGCGLTELEDDGFFGAANAGIVCAILPFMIAYPFLQDYFVKGVNIGAVKE